MAFADIVTKQMFVISHYTGIFIFSTFVFLVYCIVMRNQPKVFPKSIIPSMVSGLMWGIAQAAWLVCNGTLGIVIGTAIPSSVARSSHADTVQGIQSL